MTAAEIAGAHAGMTAAYAAYGYNFTGTGERSEYYFAWCVLLIISHEQTAKKITLS